MKVWQNFTLKLVKVPHQHLSLKLQHYSVKDATLWRMQSFLSNWSQHVLVSHTSELIIPCHK